MNVDVSTIYQGYYSDSSRMFCIGTVTEEKRNLVRTAKDSLSIGLKEVKPWGGLGDMGQAIHDYAKSNRYSVVQEIGGHGIGLVFYANTSGQYRPDVTQRADIIVPFHFQRFPVLMYSEGIWLPEY